MKREILCGHPNIAREGGPPVKCWRGKIRIEQGWICKHAITSSTKEDQILTVFTPTGVSPGALPKTQREKAKSPLKYCAKLAPTMLHH